MDAQKATTTIARMARLLAVSRSGYYAWAAREAAGPSPAQTRREVLTAKIAGFYAASDDFYGSPRILADLREAGERVSRKTLARRMAAAGIVGISPRKFSPPTTVAGPDPAPVPDLVKRVFDRGRVDAVWTSDITYLDTDQGWLYLCAVRDACSRRVIGWAIADHLRTDLVEAALRMAVTLRGQLPAQVVFHADRGCQVHLGPDRRGGNGSGRAAFDGPNRGVLGQRAGRVVLVEVQDRVLRPGPPTGPPKPERRSPPGAGSRNAITANGATPRSECTHP
jgi:putative transposase